MRLIHPFRIFYVARVDAGFLDPKYPAWRRSAGLTPDEHPGVDYNLHGTSGNADYGYPVCAMATGRVVHAKKHRVWGNVVLIEHPTLAQYLRLPYLASQYAHLAFMSVREGDLVTAGEAIGSVGRGDPRAPFLAHLHFEIRTKELPADYWPGRDKEEIRRSYLDPVQFLIAHREEEHRYWAPTGKIYLPQSQHKLGGVVVNLSNIESFRLRADSLIDVKKYPNE